VKRYIKAGTSGIDTKNILREVYEAGLWVKIRLVRGGNYWVKVESLDDDFAYVYMEYPFIEEHCSSDYCTDALTKVHRIPISSIIIRTPMDVRTEEELFRL
jgi:hypothetical protein